MISKELLSLVLGQDIDSVFDTNTNNNCISYMIGEIWLDLNLDTLGRLCKEWCIKQKRHIMVKSFHNINYEATTSTEAVRIVRGEDLSIVWQCQVNNYYGHELWMCSSKVELEVIIKATNWIANEKGLL